MRVVKRGPVEEGLVRVARLEVGLGAGEVEAAGDGDGAEPVFVGGGAGGAVYGEGEDGGGRVGGGVALDLLEGFVEVLVVGGGFLVVDLAERFQWDCWVRGDGVGDFGAEV